MNTELPLEPVWLRLEAVILAHEMQVELFGGASGIRDRGMLESAVERPKLAFQFANLDLVEIAAMYAHGIVMNHPFVDGNKRAGFVAMVMFLKSNGREFQAPQVEVVGNVLALAAGEMTLEELTLWVRASIR